MAFDHFDDRCVFWPHCGRGGSEHGFGHIQSSLQRDGVEPMQRAVDKASAVFMFPPFFSWSWSLALVGGGGVQQKSLW